jgi:hypothetical protein
MKEEQVIKFIEKLDYSYEYKTVNERQNMITELCLIAGTKQLTIPVVVDTSVCDYCSGTGYEIDNNNNVGEDCSKCG